MVTKWLSLCLIVVALSSGLNVALAQQSDDPLNGYWKQVGESVYIQITRSDDGYQAEVIRNDWAPGLVGSKLFKNVVSVSNKKPRWAGDTIINGSEISGEATVRINRSGELSTRLKPGGRATWERSQPVKKAYQNCVVLRGLSAGVKFDPNP